MTDRELHDIAFFLTSLTRDRRKMRNPPTLEIGWPAGAVLINGRRCTTLSQVKAAVQP